ncbi:MAG: lamin tail domain-containing protein [Anaerolineales bacterium]|nr:MAG: lamin tail domain-containing protein [Anaerolineales bacterium]
MERKTGDPDGPSSWVSNDGITRNGLDASGNPINGTPKQPNSSIIPTPTPTITNTPTETGTPTNTPTVTQTRTSTPSSTATPVTGPLSVLINEVAWSGTSSTRTNDEWIELHNTLSSSLNLDGWKITMDRGDGEIDFIIFNGDDEIPAGGFFLLGRALNIFNNVIVDKAFSTALPNDGVVILRLYNAQGTFIDSANLGRQSGWYAGTAATTYASMERRGKILDGANAWFTFGGTPFAINRDTALVRGSPKQANWAVNVTPTATPFRTPTRTPTPSRVPTLVVIPRLVINEILARPGFDWNQDGKVDVFDEFIEIKNLGPVTEDLSGWQLDAVNAEAAFVLPSVSLRPGERVVFYGSQTNLLLSDGGETVRLINPGRTIIDAYTYSFAGTPDRSFCRMPDREFFGSWFEDCIPTPNLVNTREGTVPSMPGGGYESLVCELPDTIPSDFLTAECRSYGTNIWNPYYWDRYGWLGWRMLQSNTSKWESYFE